MKLREIAKTLQVELRGDGDVEITGAAGIEEAGPDQLTFLSNPKYAPKIKTTRAGAIVVAAGGAQLPIPSLVSPNPYLTFAKAIELFYQPPRPIPGFHPTAVIADSARVGEGCSVGAQVVIGAGVRIGDRAVIHPGVVIYPFAEIGNDFLAHSNAVVREYCKIGNRVILQNGAVIGADGFGFAPAQDGAYYKIVQSGIAVLEDDVEIGACSCVDRATIGETRIKSGAKIDNLVQIGHGSTVGRNTVLASQVGLAGSTRVGDQVMLAGQVGVAGHLTIGDRVQATGQTGIGHSVEAGKRVSGSPEMDSDLWLKNCVLLHRLPDMAKSLRRLQSKLDELEAKIESGRTDS